MFYRTKKFRALQTEWAEKLRASKFIDIEASAHLGNPALDLMARVHFQSPEQFKANQLYFAQAREALNTVRFKSARHRKIWRLHSEGMSAPAIGREVSLCGSRVQDLIYEIAGYIKAQRKRGRL